MRSGHCVDALIAKPGNGVYECLAAGVIDTYNGYDFNARSNMPKTAFWIRLTRRKHNDASTLIKELLGID